MSYTSLCLQNWVEGIFNKYYWIHVAEFSNINIEISTSSTHSWVVTVSHLYIFHFNTLCLVWETSWGFKVASWTNSDIVWSSVKMRVVVVVGCSTQYTVRVYSAVYSYHHHYLCPVIISVCQSGLIRARSWVRSSLLTCSQSVLPDSLAAG